MSSEEVSSSSSRSQRILGGVKVDAVAVAKFTMASFERLWGSIRFIDRTHPKRQEYIEQYHLVLKGAIDQIDTLRLTVHPYAFTVDDQEVLMLDRPTENYIYRLYQDGIRQLSFSEAITAEEIRKLIEILESILTQAGNLEDDIVTMMWAAEFAGIQYQNIEGFVAGNGEADGDTPLDHAASTISVDEVMKYATSAVPITDEAIDMSNLVSSSKSFAADDQLLREQAKDLLEGVSEDKQKGAANVFRFSAAEQKELRERIEHGGGGAGAKFAEILFSMLSTLGKDALPRAPRAFNEFAIFCLENQAELMLFEAIRTLAVLDEGGRGSRIRQALLSGLAQPRLIGMVIALSQAPGAAPELAQLLEQLAAVGFQDFWKVHLESQVEGAVQLPKGLLERHAASHIPFLMDQAVKGDTVTALAALQLLFKLEIEAFAKHLLPALKHPSSVVRIEAIAALRKSTNGQVLSAITPLLDDPDGQVRRTAMIHLARLCGGKIEAPLLKILTRPDFVAKEVEEKQRTIRTIGRIATEHGLDLIRHIAAGEHPFEEDKECRVEAIQILGLKGSAQDRELLGKMAKALLTGREFKVVAREALDALNEREGAL